MDSAEALTLAVELLKRHEGLMLKPYRDTVGKLTIGYGRCLDTYGITEKEARYMLMNNICECINELHDIFGGFNEFSVNRQAALIDMVYNLGGAGFVRFRRTIEYIRRGLWDLAAEEMLRSEWAGQVGNRATELSDLIRKG